MNQQVKEELQRKVNDHMDILFMGFKDDMKKLVKPSDDICENHECLDSVREIMNETLKSLSFLARGHGIKSHDLIEAVLKMTIEGNDYARKIQATAEAFKDDKHVGFC